MLNDKVMKGTRKKKSMESTSDGAFSAVVEIGFLCLDPCVHECVQVGEFLFSFLFYFFLFAF